MTEKRLRYVAENNFQVYKKIKRIESQFFRMGKVNETNRRREFIRHTDHLTGIFIYG